MMIIHGVCDRSRGDGVEELAGLSRSRKVCFYRHYCYPCVFVI